MGRKRIWGLLLAVCLFVPFGSVRIPAAVKSLPDAAMNRIARAFEKEGIKGQEDQLYTDENGASVFTTSIPIRRLFDTFSTEDIQAESKPLITNRSRGKDGRKEWFYSQLNRGQKKICKLSLNAAKNGKNSFSMTTGKRRVSWKLLASGISAAMSASIADYEWVEMGFGRLTQTYQKAGGSFKVRVELDLSPHYSETMETKARERIAELVAEASEYAKENYPESPAYGKVEFFDSWLCENSDLSEEGLKIRNAGTKEYQYSHSSYGCLLMGYGVCESYARAMTRLLDAAGIENFEAVGLSDENDKKSGHAWNLVRLDDGNWYVTDSTWNDDGDRSTKKYLCVGELFGRKADGCYWDSSKSFQYPAVSAIDYPA